MLRWNVIEDRSRYNKVSKGEDLDSISRRDHFKCTQTCRREKAKREIKNLWHHVPRMSAMSLQTTSQHIRVGVRITSRPITAVEERERDCCGTPEREKEALYDSPVSILHLHHMTQSHKWFWNCSMLPKVSLKEKKRRQYSRRKTQRKREAQRKYGEKLPRELEGEGRKHKAMCFTAYLGLGHYEYRKDIKQIRSGMTRAAERTGQQWKHMALWFTHRSTEEFTMPAKSGRKGKI